MTGLLRVLPARDIMQSKVTPIETFTLRAEIEKKVMRRLRAQK